MPHTTDFVGGGSLALIIMEQTTISRKEFIKKGLLSIFGIMAAVKLGAGPTIPVIQNTTDAGNVIQSSQAPTDHTKMWLNTGSGQNQAGIDGRAVPPGALCFYDVSRGGWKPTTTTWA